MRQPRTRIFVEVVRATMRLVPVDSETTSSELSPTIRKSDRMSTLVSISFSFSNRGAESEFRTQPVATTVSATGDVDTIPTQMHAHAHFFSYMHDSALSAHFLCGNTTLAQGEKEFVSPVRLHSIPSRLTCLC